jgi:hypothetical protein
MWAAPITDQSSAVPSCIFVNIIFTYLDLLRRYAPLQEA